MDNEENAVIPFDLKLEAVIRANDLIDVLLELKSKDEGNGRRWAISVTDAEKLAAWIRHTANVIGLAHDGTLREAD